MIKKPVNKSNRNRTARQVVAWIPAAITPSAAPSPDQPTSKNLQPPLLSAGLLAIARKFRQKSRQGIVVAALVAGIFTVGARAQGPDYSNVNDFLNGRRTLLAIDDLVIAGLIPGDTSAGIFTFTSTTANSRLNPVTQSANHCCDGGPVVKALTGHIFNLPSSTTVELMGGPGADSQIWLPSIRGAYNSIPTSPGLIGGAIADFNGDGYDDLVLQFTEGRIQIATAYDVNDPTHVLPLKLWPTRTLDTLAAMTVGDFNGDGQPEIAGLVGLPSGALALVIYTVDPKTLTISKASQLPLKQAGSDSWLALSIAKGRFTPAAHDQIVIGYMADSRGALEVVDFAPSSLAPQEKTTLLTFKNGIAGKDLEMKLQTGKFDLPSNPYDQVVMMYAIPGASHAKTLAVLSIDSATFELNQISSYDRSDLDCIFDISVGNFDNRQPDPANPGQTQHNSNDQIALLYGGCSNGPRNVDIFNTDPNTLNIKLASSTALDSSLNGLIVQSFIASDTQGRSMILGEPTKITLNGSVQPSVVIGAPPMHVDFVSPNPGTDPPVVMNLSAAPDGYKSTYQQEDSTSKRSGSQTTTSWSFGAKESVGASFQVGDPDIVGFAFSDTLTAAQDLKGGAEHEHGTSQRQAFNLSATTGFGDEVSYLDPDFNIWVYPVIGKTVCPKAKPNCPDSDKVPLTVQFSAPNGDALTLAAQGQALQWYQPPWEPGNIFSYPATLQQLQRIYPKLSLLTHEGLAFLTDTSTVTQKTTWSVTQKDTATTSLDQNYSFENDFSYTESVGIPDIDRTSGSFKLDLSGSVGFSSLNKSTTDLEESTGVEISKPGTFRTFQDYGYWAAPYLMGTTKPGGYVDSQPLSTDIKTFGLLRAMFTADPLASGAGGWWQQAYSQAPDVALNHPSRWQITTPALENPIPKNCLATGTGASQMDCAELSQRLPTNPWLSVFHQMRGFFISSAQSAGQGPQLGQATAGDVLTLQARVYNYSLAVMPSDSHVHVRFYFMPWDTKKNLSAGDSVLIGEEELSPIPPFSDNPDAAPNWVLASATFDTGKYEQTKNGAASVVFWVVVWMQTQDGKLVQEMPGHGLATIPGSLKSLADVAEECQKDGNCYSNNVGLYHQIFYIAPSGVVGAPPPAGPASIDIGKVDLSANRINPHNTIVVSATLAAIGADASGVSAKFYDGDPDKGGRVFDVERIPYIPQADPQLVQASYRTNTCGTHELFVVVNEGKSSKVVRRAQPIRVDCGSFKIEGKPAR
jgi:hypothetical protein